MSAVLVPWSLTLAVKKRVAVLPVKARASFYNPKNHLLYLGGDSIWVDEPGQDVVVAVVAVRLSDGDLQQAFAFDSLRNRLYCLGDGDSVSVIDCAENRLVARIDVGAFPFALDYAGVADKVYCLTLGFRVQVIDAANLVILKTISVGWPSLHPLYYSPVNNRLYITDDLQGIMVIDCASDSVIGAITPPGILCGGQYNPQRNTVHLLVDDGSSVAVLDCATNSFVSRFRVPAEVFVGASFDPVNQRFYYIETDWRIGTVDGFGDSLINCQVVGPIDWNAPLTVNPLANRAYCGNVISGSISVIDGNTGAVKSVIPVGRNFGPVSMCYIPGRDVVYCANGNGVLSVIDCRTNQIVNKIPAGTGFAQMIYLPENHKVYAVANTEYDLDIINARNDSLLAEIHYEFMLKPPLLDLPNGRVYCLDGLGNIVVFDKEQDKILGTIELNAEMLEHNPIRNEVYAAGRNQKQVVVIAAGQDSISGRIEVNNDVTLLKFSPKQNRLYCFHPNGLVSLIDPQARRVIRQVFAPAPVASVQSIWNPVADKFYYSTDEKLVVFFLSERFGGSHY